MLHFSKRETTKEKFGTPRKNGIKRYKRFRGGENNSGREGGNKTRNILSHS